MPLKHIFLVASLSRKLEVALTNRGYNTKLETKGEHQMSNRNLSPAHASTSPKTLGGVTARAKIGLSRTWYHAYRAGIGAERALRRRIA